MREIDKYAYTSTICDVDLRDKLCLSLFPLSLCIFFNSYSVSIVTAFIMSFMTIWFSKISFKKYILFIGVPFGFIVLGSLGIMINSFKSIEGLLVYVNIGNHFYGISTESLKDAIKVLLRSFAAISCMYFFSFNTNINSFFLFLRRSKIPTLIVEIMELMYRFIFVIWEEGEKIYIAQSSRMGYEGLRNKISSSGELISVLFIRAFKRTLRINTSLESRGYNGDLDTLIIEKPRSLRFSLYTIGLCVLLILVYAIERLVLI